MFHRCEDVERVYQANVNNGDGDPDRNLQTVRDALGGIRPPYSENEAGMTSFEAFCARNYPGGRLYRVEDKKGNDGVKKSWNDVSVIGLIKDSLSKNENAL
jgi:hypothetical protein